MLGLKRQVGGVSLSSLHSHLLQRPPQHPWLKSHNSWLSSGVVQAAELSSEKPNLEVLKMLCKMARDGIVGGDLDRNIIYGKIHSLSKSFLENSEGISISQSCIQTALTEVWDLSKLGVIDMEECSLAKILNYCEDLFVSECEQLVVKLLEAEDDDIVADSESLLIRCIATNRNLYQKLIKVFSSLMEEIDCNQKILKAYQNICQWILSKSENAVSMFPSKYQALASLLLADQDLKVDPSNANHIDVFNDTLKSKIDLDNHDIKMIYLQFMQL